MIRMIVTASMNHERMIENVGEFETRGEHRIIGRAVRQHVQRGEISQMAVTPSFSVLLGTGWIKVAAGR